MIKLADFIFCLLLLELFAPREAHAYLDPGTGSMLLSVIVGLCSSAYFLLRRLPDFGRRFFYRLSHKGEKPRQIVFYAESATYWHTFQPVLKALAARGIAATYLTSDKNDPAFKSELPASIERKFIGAGQKGWTSLGFLEADLCVMTTPGLDVLQIARSRGVKRYAHIVHALTDIHFYKLFSFDYYDAVLCSSEAQKKSLRELEKVRGTEAKILSAPGCAYLDDLKARFDEQNLGSRAEENCVLVAPTWGRNGLLTLTGSQVPKMLAQAGYKVIVRPHPQSFVSEKELIQRLQTELAGFSNISWDSNPAGLASLARAQVLISDISGIIFDYAFTFGRPVITIGNSNLEKRAFEASDIPWPAWESTVLNDLGKRLDYPELDKLPGIVGQLATNPAINEKIIRLRHQYANNFGHAAEKIADDLLALIDR